LDLLALCETKIHDDDPPAIKDSIAPPAAAHPAGGGLAVVYRDTLDVRAAQLPSPSTTYRTFEYQLIRVSSTRPAVTLANVYRPPSTSVSLFYSELSDFLSSVGSAFDNFVICEDLNCPGSTSTSVADDLAATFDAFGLTQHVCWPTRNDNVLDMLATDNTITVGDVQVDDAGLISGHRLVVCSLSTSPQHNNIAVNRPFRGRVKRGSGKRGTRYPPTVHLLVGLSVCLSVCRVYCGKTADSIRILFGW